jgi:hypothetical protein
VAFVKALIAKHGTDYKVWCGPVRAVRGTCMLSLSCGAVLDLMYTSRCIAGDGQGHQTQQVPAHAQGASKKVRDVYQVRGRRC